MSQTNQANQVHIEASEVIEARPEMLYAIIADYREGHPAILPKKYFTEVVVEKGGQGAGTIVRSKMKVWGAVSVFRLLVAEPEPGRVLTESSLDSDLVTTFRFEPLEGGTKTRLTITTDFTASPGFKGFMEKRFQPSVARRIYQEELRQLAAYVANQKATANIG